MQRLIIQLVSLTNGLGDDKNQLQWISNENQLQSTQIDSISRLRFEDKTQRYRAGW